MGWKMEMNCKHANQLIGCCGLDCEVCDARIATLTNDTGVREKSLDTCADCGQMDSCPTLGRIAANSPFVLDNLRRLRGDA